MQNIICSNLPHIYPLHRCRRVCPCLFMCAYSPIHYSLLRTPNCAKAFRVIVIFLRRRRRRRRFHRFIETISIEIFAFNEHCKRPHDNRRCDVCWLLLMCAGAHIHNLICGDLSEDKTYLLMCARRRKKGKPKKCRSILSRRVCVWVSVW